MEKDVEVTLTERGAIYVNNLRITHRGTKWGARRILAEFSCKPHEVYSQCVERGFPKHAKNIDEDGYGKPAKAGV